MACCEVYQDIGIIIEFQSRWDAEKAFKQGRQFGDAYLDLTWHFKSGADTACIGAVHDGVVSNNV